MSSAELAMLALGGLLFAVGVLCWAIRQWRRDPTDEEFWP